MKEDEDIRVNSNHLLNNHRDSIRTGKVEGYFQFCMIIDSHDARGACFCRGNLHEQNQEEEEIIPLKLENIEKKKKSSQFTLDRVEKNHLSSITTVGFRNMKVRVVLTPVA